MRRSRAGRGALGAGSLTADDLDSAAVAARIEDSAGRWVLYAVLAGTGIVLQLRVQGHVRRIA